MIVLIIIGAFLIGMTVIILNSKKKFEKNITEIECQMKIILDSKGKSLKDEIRRFKDLQTNLKTAKQNLKNLRIEVVDVDYSSDYSSKLSKLDQYFAQHSQKIAGAEAALLSILPTSQTGEALWAFAQISPELFSETMLKSIEAIRQGATIPGMMPIGECFNHFIVGLGEMSTQTKYSIVHSLEHGNYLGAMAKTATAGLKEMTGINAATHSLMESAHDIGDTISDIAETTIQPMDWTDIDIAGHIPVITIAISSVREVKLLSNDKTNMFSAGRNIALDAIGAGGGGWAGAQAGAGIGLIFGPIGGLVGGIIGGIGGAILGRGLSNWIKERHLRDAIEKYNGFAAQMQKNVQQKSITLYDDIRTFTLQKRDDFNSNNLLKMSPIKDELILHKIAIIIYNSVAKYRKQIYTHIRELESSYWYSDGKYAAILANYKKMHNKLFASLPSVDQVNQNPEKALTNLLSMELPKIELDGELKKTYLQCYKELHQQNNRDNASTLLWISMINGDYQNTLNSITDYSNMQMSQFNTYVTENQNKLSNLRHEVQIEKEKLGYA